MDNAILNIPTEQFTSYQPVLLMTLVFFGGVISSFSPCSLGLLPVIVGYVGGQKETSSNKKIIIQLLFFVLGLSMVLTVLGVISAVAGVAFGFHASPVWALIISSFILVMGLSLLEIIELPVPVLIKQMPKNQNSGLILYPLLLGAAFALATTPCSTPILAGILAYASFKANILLGALLLFLFSFGQGIILICAGLFTSMFKKLVAFRSISGLFVKFSGVVLILTSIYIYLSIFKVI